VYFAFLSLILFLISVRSYRIVSYRIVRLFIYLAVAGTAAGTAAPTEAEAAAAVVEDVL
jgi:hypothetical protein